MVVTCFTLAQPLNGPDGYTVFTTRCTGRQWQQLHLLLMRANVQCNVLCMHTV
jgi:hypothetical protein